LTILIAYQTKWLTLTIVLVRNGSEVNEQ
jgi:hypothetical protein